MLMSNKGTLFVVSGPSGVGKGTICREIIKRRGETSLSVSATTRPMRDEDTEGVTYYFKTEAEFREMIENGGFLEWTTYNGNYYGTPIKPVSDAIDGGRDIILEIEVVGALNVRKFFPEAVLIFIAPPSFEALSERLRLRGSETPESIKSRINRAKEELELQNKYDYIVINDHLETAVSEVENIIVKESNLL